MENLFAIFCIHVLAFVESREVLYRKVYLDGSVIMDYSFSLIGVSLSRYGMLCTLTPGCKLFHFDSKSCYFLNSPAASSLNITTFYGSDNWEEICDIEEYPLFGGKFCMRFFNVSKTWEDARVMCIQQGGQLLTMKSDDYFLKKEVLTKIDGGHQYWMDGNDQDTEGDWRWSDGSKIEINQWLPNQPSNYENVEHCIYFNSANRHMFNDGYCGYPLQFVCEKLKL